MTVRKQRRAETQRLRSIKARQYVARIKASTPCADCGQSFPWYVMQFDHVRGEKSYDIARMAGQGRSLSAIDAEIAKCDIVCANCHAERTFMRVARPGRSGEAHTLTT